MLHVAETHLKVENMCCANVALLALILAASRMLHRRHHCCCCFEGHPLQVMPTGLHAMWVEHDRT